MDKKRTSFYVEKHGDINSIEEMANLTGKTVNKVLTQLGKGASDEELFHYNNISFIEVNGVVYDTLFDCLLNEGVNASEYSVLYKFSRGASIDEIIEEYHTGKKPEYIIKNKRKKIVVIEGVKYPSIEEAHNALKDDPRVKWSYNTVRQRIYKGMSVQEAFLG